MLCRNQGTYGGAVCTTAMQKEEVEKPHLGCGWKGGFGFEIRVRVRVRRTFTWSGLELDRVFLETNMIGATMFFL